MGVKLRNFEMPKKLALDESSYKKDYGKFIAEPFERGYGMTIGNSLRNITKNLETTRSVYQTLSPKYI